MSNWTVESYEKHNKKHRNHFFPYDVSLQPIPSSGFSQSHPSPVYLKTTVNIIWIRETIQRTPMTMTVALLKEILFWSNARPVCANFVPCAQTKSTEKGEKSTGKRDPEIRAKAAQPLFYFGWYSTVQPVCANFVHKRRVQRKVKRAPEERSWNRSQYGAVAILFGWRNKSVCYRISAV